MLVIHKTSRFIYSEYCFQHEYLSMTNFNAVPRVTAPWMNIIWLNSRHSNTTIKHTSCMKVSFWWVQGKLGLERAKQASRRSRVSSKTSTMLKYHKECFNCSIKHCWPVMKHTFLFDIAHAKFYNQIYKLWNERYKIFNKPKAIQWGFLWDELIIPLVLLYLLSLW